MALSLARRALPSLLLASLLPSIALAEPVLVGGESAAMGGTGVASAQDLASPYLNPAGLAQVRSLVAAASANLYGVSKISIDRFFNETTASSTLLGDTELDNLALNSSRVFVSPSAVGLLFGFGPDAGQSGHMTVGLSYLLLDHAEYFFQGQTRATTSYVGRSGVKWVHSTMSHHFGPSFAVQLGSRVRLGATVFGAYTTSENLIDSPYELSDETGTMFVADDGRAASDIASFDMLFAVGGQVQLTDHLALGLSLHTPSFHLAGSFAGVAESRTYGNDMNLLRIETTVFDGEADLGTPMRVMLGASYRVPRRWGVALDARLALPRSEAVYISSHDTTSLLRPLARPGTTELDRVSTLDNVLTYTIGAGGEVFFRPGWAGRAGFFYSSPRRQEFEDLITAADLLDIRVSKVGGVLAVTNVDNLIESTFGVVISAGTGETGAKTFASEDFRKTDVQSLDLLFFLSGGFNLANR